MASWKKVIVSGSQAELCSLTIKGDGGTIQNITDSIATTTLTGSFSGSFTGDGRELFNVTGSKVYINFPNSPNPSPAEDASILFSNETGLAAQICASGSLFFNTGTSKLTTCQIAATGFTGSLNGNADTATTTTNATCIRLTETDSDAIYNLVFATSGTYADPRIDNTLTYNASTNVLTTGGTVVVGSGAAGTVCSQGNYDLILRTGNTSTGIIRIVDGANQNICLSPNGTGKVLIEGSRTITGGDSGLILGTGNVENVCVTNDLNVGGDLIVGGDLAYLNVTNLAVEDQFILLASGSAATGDSGIIFGGSEGASGSGSALFWDASYNTNDGRLSIANGIAQDATSTLSPAYRIAGVFEGNDTDAATAQADHLGNIRIDGEDIYIYSGTY